MSVIKPETPREEVANAITHGMGVVLSIVGLLALLYREDPDFHSLKTASFSIFGGSMIVLYLASTCYHAFFRNPRLYRFFQLMDHSAIYVLIAGTYTPFSLVALKGEQGVVMFFSIWALAVLGVIFKLFFIGKFKKLSLMMYLGMGWLGMAYYNELMTALELEGFSLILIGGLFYTLGTIFYIWEKLPFNHAIWHLFVMGGSASLYFCIYFYVW
ncbi:PAQR family membrane homeostasis protein TrhA [Algivirga pacifica]|uniref:Hemolysin III family protein n=1 Tax=Algivirga pacifica TaxID=1162670 RepID=A0ABP9D843_9BACT